MVLRQAGSGMVISVCCLC